MSPLPRELVRWIQTLDLPLPIKNAKRDLCNGYLFAEICARYWTGFEMHSFENKLSKPNKEANWKVLRRYFAKHAFDVEESLIVKVIECEDGAAENMLFALYRALTKREIQVFPPSHEPEVDVPVFVKQTGALSGGRQQQQQQQLQTQQELEAQRLADAEKQKQEALKRNEAQQRQQQTKPKTMSKTQAIKAVDASEEDSGAQAVQFSAVTVKPLPAQMLARFGSQKAATESNAGGGEGGAGGGLAGSDSANSSDGVVALITTQISVTLLEGDLPLFQTSGAAPTIAEYFFKNLSAIDPNIRNLLWSQLLAKSEMVANRLAQKPSEYSSFTELLTAHLLYHHNKLQSLETSHNLEDITPLVIKYFTTVTSLLAATNPAVALSSMKSVFIPLISRGNASPLVPGAPFSSITHEAAEHYAPLLLAFIDGNGYGNIFSSPFFSALYDGLCAAPSSLSSPRTRSDFLMILYAVLKGFTRKKSAVPGQGSDSYQLEEHCAGVAYYNTVAGLHSESSRDRLVAMKLLVRLVEFGVGHLVLDNGHVGELVEQLAAARASWTRSAEGLTLFTQLVVALIESRSVVLKEEHIEQLDKALEMLYEMAVPSQDAPVRFMRVLPTSARLFVFHSLFRVLWVKRLDDSVAKERTRRLVEYVVSPKFTPHEQSILLNEESAASVVFQSPLLGAVTVNSIVRAACPLRLSLAVMEVTEVLRQRQLQAQPQPMSGTSPKEPAVTTQKASPNIAKSANRILKHGEVDEVALLRLHWILTIFSGQDLPLSTDVRGSVSDEELLTAWWGVMKGIEGNVNLALYTAELLNSQLSSLNSAPPAPGKGPSTQPQPPSERVTEYVFHIAALAQAIVIRCYIDFSGNVMPPRSSEGYLELRADPNLPLRATEWFTQVVVAN